MPDIFLSYSREDQPTARRFAEGLQRAGFSVWWDQALHPGEAFDQVTEQALEEAKAVIVLWSKASVTSRWVRAEATQANASNRLVPAMIEPCKRPIMFELTHSAELSDWKGNPEDPGWKSFVASLRLKVGSRAPDNPVHSARHSSDVVAARRGARAATIAVAAFVLLGGTVVGIAALLARQNSGLAVLPTVETPARIFVRPFSDQSAGSDPQHVAAALTVELSSELGKIGALRPFGESTIFSELYRTMDSREIGKKLGAAYLVEASVVIDGGRVTVYPQLIDTGNGVSRWQDGYEGGLDDVDELKRKIATGVARGVGITLGASDLPPDRGGTTDARAYDLFARATDLWRRTGGNVDEVVQVLDEAVKQDPKFVRARLLMVPALSRAASGKPGVQSAALLKKKEEAVSQLASMSLEGWLADEVRAMVAAAHMNWQAAVDAAESAADGAPSKDMAAAILWPIQVQVGQFAKGIENLQRVVDADPQDANLATLLWTALLLKGRIAEAENLSARLQSELGVPDISVYGEFQRLLDEGSSTNPADLRSMKGFLTGRDGKRALTLAGLTTESLGDPLAVRTGLKRAFADPANQGQTALDIIAKLAHFFGENDLAFAAFRRSVLEIRGYPLATWATPFARRDPRFLDLMQDMGLADYWRGGVGNWGDFCEPVDKDNPGGAFECH